MILRHTFDAIIVILEHFFERVIDFITILFHSIIHNIYGYLMRDNNTIQIPQQQRHNMILRDRRNIKPPDRLNY